MLRGSVLAAWRLLRCNPWSAGGVDHVHDQTLFAAPRTHSHAVVSTLAIMPDPIVEGAYDFLAFLHDLRALVGPGHHRADRRRSGW